ncbi:Uncharacterized protein HZ326_2857 [Fusarium oxysporum f. sp. albedinis]|nr:Uncharacterized protein HZ326_2857 [Fusarium oxysporum f. sp. albedinis]
MMSPKEAACMTGQWLSFSSMEVLVIGSGVFKRQPVDMDLVLLFEAAYEPGVFLPPPCTTSLGKYCKPLGCSYPCL